MKFDRNTVIGFVVLAALFFGFFYFNSQEQATFRKEQARLDSISNAQKPKPDPTVAKVDTTRGDSINKVYDSVRAGGFQGATAGNEQITTVTTELFTIAFTNKGARPLWIELSKFKNMDSGHVRLASSGYDLISYMINTGKNGEEQTANTGDLYFQPGQVTKNSDGSTTVSFSLNSADSMNSAPSIRHEYIVKPDEYMVDFNIHLNGADKLLSRDDTRTKLNLALNWRYSAAQQETDINYEKQNTQVGYVEDEEFDYHTIGKRSSINFTEPVKWVGVRQRFFNSYLIAKDNFTSGTMEWTVPPDETKVIVQANSTFRYQMPVATSAKAEFNLFYGPADYRTLKSYDIKMSKLINLGQGMYAFVRPLNRFVILPVWDFIKGFVNNYGLVIAFLTLFIRLVISPLTYKSYLSGAKMKALRPEIALLKQKHGSDQQAMSMDQMKLFREAGVNPLGGCIPALLQIPIFFALFSFFNAEPGLRGADFLWSSDLSAFDAPIKFGMHIPLLGSHLSLFNITAVVTSFLISIYSMSMTPDQSNPVMKYMPYIFPVFLLFFFNSLPSALTWYYTVSNLVTLILQFVIQNYIIDHNKILAKIDENRKKPKTKTKWQERMEQMQEQQKKMKEMQQKGKR
ncbi:MAG: membrane protein insertase YidC [Chitinophagaceae bacterium]|nr:membrane protein insertase YidC [Chitinophagaceae bacterium]